MGLVQSFSSDEVNVSEASIVLCVCRSWIWEVVMTMMRFWSMMKTMWLTMLTKEAYDVYLVLHDFFGKHMPVQGFIFLSCYLISAILIIFRTSILVRHFDESYS